MEDRRAEPHHANGQENQEIILGESKQQQSRQGEAHAHREGVRSRMLVGIEPREGLQDG